MKKIGLILFFSALQIGTAKADYIKGVTYFGDAWPINFWNSGLNNVKSDFEHFKKEGFNTATVVVPWGEFQPDTASDVFNEQAYARLTEVCQTAQKSGMKFFMRVSYLWDMHPDVKLTNYERFSRLVNDASMQDAWSRYLSKVSSATRDCASGVFISWEDYWFNIDRIKNANTLEQRVEYSKYYGFDDWMKNNYKKCGHKCNGFLVNGFYAFPKKDTKEFKFVYEWIDSKLSDVLLPIVAKHFDSASIEVRVDDDPIYDGKKIVEWYSHKKTYKIKSSDYVFTYWAPAMGAKNEGEKDSANDVLKRFGWINKKVADASKNKIVIAQLLFEDNTPSAAKNAVIIEEQKPEFFQKLPKPLLQQTHGYMLWGAKDYDANMIFNPAFDLGLKGWVFSGKNNKKNHQSGALKISAGESVEQKVLSVFNHFKGASNHTYLRLDGQGSAEIEISYAGGIERIKTSAEKKKYDLKFPVTDQDSNFSIKVISGNFAIADVNLYPFTTVANFRGVSNQPGVRYQDILGINQAISRGEGVPHQVVIDEQSLSTVSGVHGIEGKGSQRYAWASSGVRTKLFAKSPSLEMSGYLPESKLKKDCEIKFLSNGKEIDKNKVEFGHGFQIKTSIPNELVGKVVELAIVSDCKVDGGKDKRDLSYILKEISFN